MIPKYEKNVYTRAENPDRAWTLAERVEQGRWEARKFGVIAVAAVVLVGGILAGKTLYSGMQIVQKYLDTRIEQYLPFEE